MVFRGVQTATDFNQTNYRQKVGCEKLFFIRTQQAVIELSWHISHCKAAGHVINDSSGMTHNEIV